MMTLGRHALWRKVVAFLPLLLLALALPAQALMRCRMDGRLRTTCCCPAAPGSASDDAQAASTDAPAVATIESALCCDREVVGGHLPPSELRRGAPEGITAPVFVELAPRLPLLIDPLPVRAQSAFAHARPAREGPSLLILKQTFLI
jgi:hypothetical protein